MSIDSTSVDLISRVTRHALRDHCGVSQEDSEKFDHASAVLAGALITFCQGHQKYIDIFVEAARPGNRSQRSAQTEYVIGEVCIAFCKMYVSRMGAKLMRDEFFRLPCDGLLDPKVILTTLEATRVTYFGLQPPATIEKQAKGLAIWPFINAGRRVA